MTPIFLDSSQLIHDARPCPGHDNKKGGGVGLSPPSTHFARNFFTKEDRDP